mgnify:CR=1 FL=1
MKTTRIITDGIFTHEATRCGSAITLLAVDSDGVPHRDELGSLIRRRVFASQLEPVGELYGLPAFRQHYRGKPEFAAATVALIPVA